MGIINFFKTSFLQGRVSVIRRTIQKQSPDMSELDQLTETAYVVFSEDIRERYPRAPELTRAGIRNMLCEHDIHNEEALASFLVELKRAVRRS